VKWSHICFFSQFSKPVPLLVLISQYLISVASICSPRLYLISLSTYATTSLLMKSSKAGSHHLLSCIRFQFSFIVPNLKHVRIHSVSSITHVCDVGVVCDLRDCTTKQEIIVIINEILLNYTHSHSLVVGLCHLSQE
jgi:hypothetical protein